MLETSYEEKTYFEAYDNGVIYKIREWSNGCFAGKDILGSYRIATQNEIKNSPKITEHFVSHETKGFSLKENQYLIAIKE